MYRLLNILKDAYVTNKIVAGSGSVTSNTGEAGTLDLFKIHSSSSLNGVVVERSRGLVQPDLDPLRALTGSIMGISGSGFKTYLRLKDVYGGQTVPSNYILSLFPVGKAWDEGRGFDVKEFRDLDAVNWLTASVSTGTPVTWSVSGACATGSLGSSGVDIYTLGDLGFGSQSLEIKQTFTRGDEDLYVDITSLVSGTLAGLIPDYGWRLSFTSSLETDTNTYFVKRFGTRHTSDPLLHPKLVVVYDDSLQDNEGNSVFGYTNVIRTYNSVNGSYLNFSSGSSLVTGSNCLNLVLVASKSIQYTTSSFQQNFSASITYTTSSYVYYSASFSGSQTVLAGLPVSGFYETSVLLNPQIDANLNSFLAERKSIGFQTFWKSSDNSVLYSSGSFITISLPQSTDQVVTERNFVVNVTNLKTEYVQSQTSRLRVFIQDRNTELPAFRLPVPVKSLIFTTMYWRLLNAYTKKVVIPFHPVGTKLSSDGFGMYFDMYVQDLDPNVVYELEFQITENNRDYFVTHEGFRFKVVP